MKGVLGACVGEVGAQLVAGAVTAVEVCEAALARQAAVAALRPFITTTHHTARLAAAAAHRRYECGKPLGALDGIPVAVKDNFCVQGILTTCGSRMLTPYVPPYSATVVERLLGAGAVLMGKTNLDEFAMGSGTLDSSFGPSKNIYRSGMKYSLGGTEKYPTSGLEDGDWVVAGGSSGGSALAVATGTAYLALGSDTGGSVRNPSSYCGVVGLKPSYGVVPRWGLVSLVNSMDVPGLVGRCVDDVAAMLAVVAGLDPKDSTSVSSDLKGLQLPPAPSLAGVVVGVPREYHQPGTSREVVEAWTRLADTMEEAGAEVMNCPPGFHAAHRALHRLLLHPQPLRGGVQLHPLHRRGVRAQGGGGAVHGGTVCPDAAGGLNEVVRGRVLAGNYFLLKENRKKYFEQALKVRRLIWQDFEAVWRSGVSLLLTPTTPTPALRYSEFSALDNRTQVAAQDICTQAANMAGVGAVSVPVGMGRQGVPLALQLMAPRGHDAHLLAAAKWIEQHVNFPRLLMSSNYLINTLFIYLFTGTTTCRSRSLL
ncbi:Glutamyl-tRNA(Gln) amidotransferase subunit A, mitochondrial [Chionoecetes opilio]|uniref:Glutamyl-tRNA(Gln) amidotransferase subunit A, mitochondrial n=1 Tax=Chionoecetes opilio TaxID=41210 RepID=A0A8J4YH05_CHIOP|nr:Glutamyl-tRNA(Gln) amidotransferase subunit A, mitochondrial [Chionoecetes opilio]